MGERSACMRAQEPHARRADTVQADRPSNRYGQNARTVEEHNNHEPTMVEKRFFGVRWLCDTRFLYCADGAAGKRSVVDCGAAV